MPYHVRHSLKTSNRFEIVNNQTQKVVGVSTSRSKALASIGHREQAEGKNIKKYKRTTDNKMHAFGETDLGKHTVRINKSKKKNNQPGDIIDTIVHEKAHILHPNMYERNIRKHTAKKLLHMGRKQKQKHYNLFKA